MTENENVINNTQNNEETSGTPPIIPSPTPEAETTAPAPEAQTASAPEAETATPAPETETAPAPEAQTPPAPPKAPAPENGNQTYTWQNPNPYNGGYNGYNGYNGQRPAHQADKPKRKLGGTEIALICVGAVSVILLIAVIAMFMSAVTRTHIADPDVDNDISQDFFGDDTDDSDNEADINRPTEDLPTLETQDPTTDALTIPKIYNKVKDSVVGITVTITGSTGIEQGSGTGIILSEDGYISTNAHVVDGASTIKVILTDESEHNAQLIGIDTRTDLAVLKIEKTGLQPAEFGNSDSLQVGETVVAIGNPYGMELAGTVTSGIVSALNRQIVIEGFYMTLIQTDASINPGNSGGPLVNSYGQVIGITSSKIVQSGYEGIGFAIPMSGATAIIQDLIQYGYIKDRPYIGITGYDIDQASAAMYSLPQGVRVESVDPESDAYAKGLKRGDIIIAVDGTDITSMADLESEKNKKKPGDTLTLTVYRNTKELDITIVLSESTAD